MWAHSCWPLEDPTNRDWTGSQGLWQMWQRAGLIMALLGPYIPLTNIPFSPTMIMMVIQRLEMFLRMGVEFERE